MQHIAIAEPQGLVDIDELPNAKAVVASIAVRLSENDLLERIANSRFPVELLQFLPHVYGQLGENLQPVVKLLLDGCGDHFDEDALRGFADVYWSNVVRDRIARKDYQRAWNELKNAFRGARKNEAVIPEDQMHYTPVHGTPLDIAASFDCVLRLVQELHAAMCKAELLPDVLSAPQPKVRFVSAASSGILFAVAIKGYSQIAGTFTLQGRQAVAIATYLNKQRNEARNRKRAQALEKSQAAA